MFVALQLFNDLGEEVTFLGASDAASPLPQGWLRASHRKLDEARSKIYQLWHVHDEIQKLMPGEFYPLDVEIWPTSIVVHPGYKLVLRIEGSDFQRMVPSSVGMGGSGVFLHNDPMDSPIPEYAGTTTIATGKDRDSFLVLPLQPAR